MLSIELIYRTPLINWNPYGITQYDPVGDFYRIPFEFYENYDTYRDPSDTNGLNWGQDIKQNANGAYVTGGGHYIQFQKIPGVNRIMRQRWPIPLVHADKNPGLMQARALKHMLNQKNSQDLLKTEGVKIQTAAVVLWTSNSTDSTHHAHRININSALVDLLAKGETITVPTEYDPNLGHRHGLKISRTGSNEFIYNIVDCDNAGKVCDDGHRKLCNIDPMNKAC